MLANRTAPVGTPDLIHAALNNSNTAGVSGTAVGMPGNVQTGMEFSINLEELGWDGTSVIKIAGFINADGHDFVSNQVVGGLPEGTGNLGDPALLDLGLVDGRQFIAMDECLSDYDRDGFPTGDDFTLFVTDFENGHNKADVDGDCFLTGDDFTLFVTAFESGC